ncbi:MAG TPA: GGDEF domain-containing phosphodiesterase [Asanoa sp.]
MTVDISTSVEPPQIATPGPPAAPVAPVPAGWLRDQVATMLGRDLTEFTIARLTVHDLRDIGGALGSDAAVDLLARVGQRLADRLRPGEAWMTLPDGDFMVLLTEATPSQARRRLTDLVRGGSGWTPEAYGQLTGGAATADDATSVDDLFSRTDLALAAAARGGPGTVTIFAPALRAGARERVRMVADLRRAVEAGRLTVHYQPVVALTGATRPVVGHEALVRWPEPGHGWIQPDRFIPAAERAGLIGDVGLQVARQAILDRRRYGDRCSTWLSVNVSPLQLDGDGFAHSFLALLSEVDVPGHLLRIEVTESALLGSTRAGRQLEQLRRQGVKVLVDDFGTGFSSLASLRRLPIDGIKIARELLYNGDDRLPDPSVVRAVRLLAEGAGVTEIIAEGVESAAEARALGTLGVPYAQGFHLGRPAPASRAFRRRTEAASSSVRSGPGGRGLG